MKMLFQKVLCWFDLTASKLFRLEYWGTGGFTINQWTYFIRVGKTIGIVGADGHIHTMMGSRAVHHHYQDGKVVKRIPVRKDLQPGERLATKAEIFNRRQELAHRGLHGFSN